MLIRLAVLRHSYEPSDEGCRVAAEGGASLYCTQTGSLRAFERPELGQAASILGRRFTTQAMEIAAGAPDKGWPGLLMELTEMVARSLPGDGSTRIQLASGSTLSQADREPHVQHSARLRISYLAPSGICARVGVTLPEDQCGPLARGAALDACQALQQQIEPAQPPASAGRLSFEPGKRMRVLFAEDAACFLVHELIGHNLEWSPATQARMERLGALSPLLTVRDNPRAQSFVMYARDTEDVACADGTSLVYEGQVTGFIHDRRSASASGQAATGNGRRQDYCYVPVRRMSCLEVQAGHESIEHVLAEHTPGGMVRHVTSARCYRVRGVIELFTPSLLLWDGVRYQSAGPAIISGDTDAMLTHGLKALSDRQHESVHACRKDEQTVNVVVKSPDVVIECQVAPAQGSNDLPG